ncbi:non-canonical purine NTP pyrophosphatase [Vibrio splendidus]|nr:non-canonical purine NTP pyrophosphatase [Vibrio splendidus]MCC4882539.1 non-canonical purine NTP pyrophosphatase [Vibrio splendidus]
MSQQYKLVTSNENKITEFNRLAGDLSFSIEKGQDLKEVKSNDAIEVAIYKAIDAGVGCIVEDTILTIDGEEVTDIRYRLDELRMRQAEARLSWITTLAVCHEDRVEMHRGVINGRFSPLDIIPDDAFGFDPFFIPDGETKSLYVLEKEGIKDQFSARKLAIDSIRYGNSFHSILLSGVSKWEGEYQE